MTSYICDQPYYVDEYYFILDKITLAKTHNDFDICQELIDNFHVKHSKKIIGFWWFTWEVDYKQGHAAWESLQHQLTFRMKYEYDSSRTFGQ